jgi:ferric-dicitrate binding protein FerR (iron transport regulator)
MTMEAKAPEDAMVSREVARLAQLVRDDLEPDPAHASAHAWDEVLVRLDRRHRRLRMVFATACVATIIPLALVALQMSRRDRPLQLSFTGARLGDHGQITRTSDLLSSLLHFSDGTEVELRSNASAHLLDVQVRGATLALDHGAARFRVVPLPGAHWVVWAGPFRVEVKGTVFELEWAPQPGRLRLRLHRGSVAVKGPLSGDPILLRGQRELLVDLPRREVKIIDQGTEPSSRPAAPATSESAVAPVESTAPPAIQGAHQGHHVQSWQALFASGKLDRILIEAEDAGFDASLSHRSNEDLAALADAARYRGRVELARRTLLSQRTRFPHSLRAVEAAFLLGRLDEASAQPAQALGWYDAYLAQAPHGRYAAEALGRKILVVQKLRGADQARPLAEEYLRRYPEGGGYTELARKLALH